MFNHTTLEQDIKRLSQEVQEKRMSSEHRDLSDRELVHKAIEPFIKGQSSGAPLAASDDAGQASDENSILPEYLLGASADVKLRVEKLIDLMFHSGIRAAIAQAKKTDDPFFLDALHDAITDKLYEELKQRKLL